MYTVKSKKLLINCISDDMLRCATEKGYKLPCVSIKQYYSMKAEFIIDFKDNGIKKYSMNVLNDNNKVIAIYLID